MQADFRTQRQWTGIPASIGIDSPKTLLKIASRPAEKGRNTDGPALDWNKAAPPDTLLAVFAVAVPVEIAVSPYTTVWSALVGCK